ncbi:sulfite exporter TauE/SafE family protein [Pseudolabrys sp. FHR47]|uniref:sulfite exporter TauE/SafE family protein n=1 Tax=Pseudolabrys sp. FHR47 TaxID=2562284 RepID=UPI0010BEBC44|nr:sulfite exporter TauE/SafE family protein [Pseudolabrys sp. FHR47]
MDGPILALFVLSTFVGGMVNGLAGFAMGLVVSGVWLHILTPAQTAALICGYGILVQSYSIWKMRHALNLRTLAPFIGGGLFGVPIGAVLLGYIKPDFVRDGVGVLLIAYSSYFLIRPHVHSVKPSLPADVTVGFVNGILGGMTGLTGPVITIWCQLRGLRKDEQRAVFQPVILAAFVLTAISLTANGTVTFDLMRVYLYGLPALGAGLWVGLKLYGHLNEDTFRKVVLVLLMLSGLVLVFG